MPTNIKAENGMDATDVQLLQAMKKMENKFDSKFASLEATVSDGVNGRFKDNERRITNLETNQKWVVLGILGAVLGALMSMILK